MPELYTFFGFSIELIALCRFASGPFGGIIYL
jgi:hypothetical protein